MPLLLALFTAQAADVVPLRFGCAEGVAEVRTDQTTTLSDGDAPPQTETARPSFTTERWQRDGELCRVSILSRNDAADAPPLVQVLTAAMREEPLVDVLDARGALVRVEGIDRIAGLVRSALDPALAEAPPEVRAALATLLDQALSPEAMTAESAENWTARAAFWHGRDAVPDAFHEGGGTPEHPDRFSWRVSPAPCPDGSTCVRLILLWTPDEARLNQRLPEMLGPVAEALAAQGDDLSRYGFRLSERTLHELLVDPVTLRPYRHREEEQSLLTSAPIGGAPLHHLRTQVRDTVWTWQPATP